MWKSAANHIHETTTHPISNVIAGELTQEEKGKEQTLNMYAREKYTANAKSGRNHRPHSVGTHSTQMNLNTIGVEFAQVEEWGRKVDFHSIHEGKDASHSHSSVTNTPDITRFYQEHKIGKRRNNSSA